MCIAPLFFFLRKNPKRVGLAWDDRYSLYSVRVFSGFGSAGAFSTFGFAEVGVSFDSDLTFSFFESFSTVCAVEVGPSFGFVLSMFFLGSKHGVNLIILSIQ